VGFGVMSGGFMLFRFKCYGIMLYLSSIVYT
jgi:hypothetical protein